MSERVAFVTGAGGGLGAAAVRLLAERGWRVFAADLDEAVVAAELGDLAQVTPIALDVTDDASVARAHERVTHLCDGLDAVVNFAGILVVGSVIELDPEAVRRVLDVNVLGTVRVNRALFPLVLARRGRLVNVSSEIGWQTAMPFAGPYAMSKHAVEAYSDALRRELAFLGVPVIKIQPGPFRTSMVQGIEQRFRRAIDDSRYFAELLGRLAHLAYHEEAKASDPRVLAEAVHEALTARRPRIAYSVRPDRARALLARLPVRLADALLLRVLSRLAARG